MVTRNHLIHGVHRIVNTSNNPRLSGHSGHRRPWRVANVGDIVWFPGAYSCSNRSTHLFVETASPNFFKRLENHCVITSKHYRRILVGGRVPRKNVRKIKVTDNLRPPILLCNLVLKQTVTQTLWINIDARHSYLCTSTKLQDDGPQLHQLDILSSQPKEAGLACTLNVFPA